MQTFAHMIAHVWNFANMIESTWLVRVPRSHTDAYTHWTILDILVPASCAMTCSETHNMPCLSCAYGFLHVFLEPLLPCCMFLFEVNLSFSLQTNQAQAGLQPCDASSV